MFRMLYNSADEFFRACTLIKQINGIVAGQDHQLAALKEKLDVAASDRQAVIEKAQKMQNEAAQQMETAASSIKQAQNDISEVKKQAAAEIEAAQKERDQALRERDDARTIAAEKTASNDLLMRQMAAMEIDTPTLKALQADYAKLQADFTALQQKAKEDAKEAAEKLREQQLHAQLDQERAVITKEHELQAQIRTAEITAAKLQVQVEFLEKQLE